MFFCKILLKFLAFFKAICSFFCWKLRFQPAFGLRSSQKLVEIYNTNWFQFDLNKNNFALLQQQIYFVANINPVGCSFQYCADTMSTFNLLTSKTLYISMNLYNFNILLAKYYILSFTIYNLFLTRKLRILILSPCRGIHKWRHIILTQN